jgi:hypothetical protein
LIASTGEIDQQYTIDGVHLIGYGWARIAPLVRSAAR